MIPETAVVGGTTFPLVAGAPSSSLTDPVALGLLDFFAHWLNVSLNPQLAVMSPHGAQAVPSANKFAYDPQGFWVRSPTPALYVWWIRDVMRPYSTLRDLSVSTYGMMYVADQQIVGPDGIKHFEGFTVQAKRALRLAEDRGFHPTFGLSSAAAGTPLGVSLDIQWGFTRMEHGAMAPVPATSSAVGGPGEGGITRYFPVVQGEIEVLEIAGQPIPRVPEDLLGDMTVDIRTNEAGDVSDTIQILERVVGAPDGSEQP